MGIFSDKDKAARANLRAAREHLADVSEADRRAGRREESDAFLDANDRVIKAEEPLPWWKRLDIDHTIG